MVDLKCASFVASLTRTRAADASFFATRAANGQKYIAYIGSC
jgi:hypothetical protein